MNSADLKLYLLQIADNITADTTIQDVYEQLSLIADIEQSEKEVENGETLSHKEVMDKVKEWLK